MNKISLKSLQYLSQTPNNRHKGLPWDCDVHIVNCTFNGTRTTTSSPSFSLHKLMDTGADDALDHFRNRLDFALPPGIVCLKSKEYRYLVTYKPSTIRYRSQSTYIYRAPQCMSPRWNWDSPTPLAASECALPPGPKGGGAHSPAAKGVGESQFHRLEKRLALYLLCGCAAHIGTGGVKIKKEPRQRDEYVYRIS